MQNDIIENYDDFFKKYKQQIKRYNFYKKIIYKYKPNGNLLDIGCANGYFLKTMENKYSTYGVELNKYAAINAKKLLPKSKIYNNDASNLFFLKSNFFDIITAFDVLEHIQNTEQTLKEIKRVLKSNGLVIITVPNTSSLGHKLKGNNWFGYRDKTHVSVLSKNEWIRLFKKHDFEIVDIFYEGYFDIPYYTHFKFLQKIFLLPGFLMYLTGCKLIGKNGENIVFILNKI